MLQERILSIYTLNAWQENENRDSMDCCQILLGVPWENKGYA